MKLPAPILFVSRRLGNELRERVVFVGGMIRGLLVTDPAAGLSRPTKDVDLIIDVASRVEMAKLSEKLRGLGFRESTEEGAPLCRWKVDDVTVDVMPVDPAILGFSNVWYPGGMRTATVIDTVDGPIRVIDGPHFCATKLEAFASRGDGDFYHHDIEDVIALVDLRPELLDEIKRADRDVRQYLAQTLTALLADPTFVEALPGNLDGDAASQARLPLVLRRLAEIAAFAEGPVAPPPSLRLRSSFAPARLPSRAYVQSTNLRGAEYDEATSTLTIDFHSGRVYVYDGVPREVFDGLMRAASAGQYHDQWIKRRYPYRRLA